MAANENKYSADDGHAQRTDKQVAARVSALAAPVCRDESLELVYTEYRRESAGRVLRLNIDKPGGVS